MDSPESMLVGQEEELERVLWTAARTLQERAALLRRLARQIELQGASRLFEQKADNLGLRAQKIRQIIAAKDKGGHHAHPARDQEPAPPTNVVNIMDALKRSVEGAAPSPTTFTHRPW